MEIKPYISQIELCGWHVNTDYNTITLCFEAPKEMLNGKYPEAEFMTISIEFPIDHYDARYSSVRCSPTRYYPEDDAYSDYDWFDVDMSYEDIEKLFYMAE